MRLSRRLEDAGWIDAPTLAVPLTPAEITELVTALNEDDRLTRINRPDIGGGPSYARSQAGSILSMAGIAAALGHSTVPVLTQEIGMFEYVLLTLQQWAPGGQITQHFEALLGKLHALSGAAKVNRWQVEWDAEIEGMRWKGPPPATNAAGRLAIGDGQSPAGDR